jgi:hypothetical protein
MSIPDNVNANSSDEIKNKMKGALNALEDRYNSERDKLDLSTDVNKLYNQALFNNNKLSSTQLFTKQVLSNTLAEQLDEIDTKHRMIQYTEADLSINQDLVKTMYILLFIILGALVLAFILSYTGYLNSGTTTSSSSFGLSSLFSSDSGSSTTTTTTTDSYFSKLFGGKKKK